LNAGGPNAAIAVSGGQFAQTSGTISVGGVVVAGGSIVDLSGGSFSATTSTSNFGTSAGTAVLNVSGVADARFQGLSIGVSAGAGAVASISGGTVSITGLVIVGVLGTGTWTQSGGVVNTTTFGTNIGNQSGSVGTLLFSGAASFTTASMSVGGGGSGFVQQSGSSVVNVAGAITISPGVGAGTCLISTGTLSAGTIEVQEGGFFSQTSGVITSSTRINLNGGFINSVNNSGQLMYNSGSANLIHNSGSITLNSADTFSLTGLSNLAGGSISIPSSRAISVSNHADLGGSTAVSGGTLTCGSISIGAGNVGTLLHSAGMVSAGRVSVATGSPGTYSLSGGELNVGSLTIGSGSAGTFSQTGGSAVVSGGVALGTITGRYLLSAGTLTAGSFVVNAGSTFSQSGGLLTVSDGLLSAGTVLLTGGTASCGSVQTAGTAAVTLAGATLNTALLDLSGGTFATNSGALNAARVLISGGTLLVNAGFPFSTLVEQTGGTLSGDFVNHGTFSFTAGVVSGRIINNNVLHLQGNLVAGDGVANHASLTVGSGRTLAGNGQGIDNFGTLVLAGGVLSGNSPIVNEIGAVMLARGTIQSVGTFTNEGLLDATGPLVVSAPAVNNGLITAGLTESINSSGGLSNSGQIQLAGGLLAGGIVNAASGSIRGFGQVSAAMNVSSGLIVADHVQPLVLAGLSGNSASGMLRVVDGATMLLAAQLTNNGLIQLDGPGASLGGAGTIVNSGGTIRGAGRILNPIQNGGTLRADTGDLDIVSPLTNVSAGRVEIAGGRRVTLLGGMQPNEGLIVLGGGTLELGQATLTNSLGRIEGRGAIRAGSLVNNASITLSGGNSEIFAPFTQGSPARTIITGFGTTTFYEDVTNQAGTELRVSTGATAIFLRDVQGLSHITGGGVKVFEGAAAGGPLITPGSTVVTPGAHLMASGLREHALQLQGQATINGTIVSRLNQLSIAGAPGAWTGRLDLTDDPLIFDYSGPSPLSIVAHQVASGFAGGAWNGAGLASSVAGGQPNRALGFAHAPDLGAPSSFFGEPIDATTILVRLTLPGDANLDALVDIRDFALLASNFNTTSYWAKGDFNYNGLTDLPDFSLLAANFNQSLAPTLLTRGQGFVPEPSGAVLLALCAGWRRRRRA
ncbi:MAG: hypothetical protein NZ561_09940, partial [Phycisphaerae bacterium]|nr:hypothetical protein [Phycisphaerae bacterium]